MRSFSKQMESWRAKGYLLTSESCEFLGISGPSLQGLVKRNKIKVKYMPNGYKLFNMKDLMKLKKKISPHPVTLPLNQKKKPKDKTALNSQWNSYKDKISPESVGLLKPEKANYTLRSTIYLYLVAIIASIGMLFYYFKK